MDIILQTDFGNNGRLPLVPVPGFFDDFDRPAGPLGSTPAGRPWQFLSSVSNPVFAIDTSGQAGLASGGGNNIAYVDTAAYNGTYEITPAVLGSEQAGGPAFRIRDLDNYLRISTTSDPAHPLILSKRLGAVQSTVATSTAGYTAGDVIAVVLDGANITVKKNGATIMTAVVNDFRYETKAGIFTSNASYGMKFDNARFIAA